MAALTEMGEVDELHSKDENSIVTNGDVSNDAEMETIETEDDTLKKSNLNTESNSTFDDTKEEEEEVEEEEEEEEEEAAEKEDEIIEDDGEETATAPNENTEDSSSQASKEDESSDEENEDEVKETDENTQEMDVDKAEEESLEKEENDDDEEEGEEEVHEETVDNGKDKHEDEVKEDDEKMCVDNDEEKKNDVDDNEKNQMEIHEIDSDDDDEEEDEEKQQKSNETQRNDEPIELNDSGGENDGDVMIVDSPKQNGSTEIIDLESGEKMPESEESEVDQKPAPPPRRSVRNLNKSKSYCENDKEEYEKVRSGESDVEEVLPQDPLACNDAITVEKVTIEKPKPTINKQSTIVVKDTKRLVEIASKTTGNSSGQGKKEPTLVIIDTNSILSGKGAVPVNSKVSNYPTTVLPMALPAQGMYPPNMRATITPIPVTTNQSVKNSTATITQTLNVPPLLPSLTDDMFVVEAPSFIVPYVYEKPPSKTIGEFVKTLKLEDSDNEDDDDDDNEKESKEKDNKERDLEAEIDKSIEMQNEAKKPYSFFESPLGKFFINIGTNLVQEHVQMDLLKQQKRKANREGNSNSETEKAIQTLSKNLEFSKENNEPYRLEMKKCEFCTFRTESALVMAYHLETPHMKNFVYRCNFCPYEIRSPHDILFHMEAEHAVRGHLERAPGFHQCPSCPFEDNQKGKLSRHLVACARKFKPERNLEPPVDWEPPAKIPRVPKMRQQGLNATVTAYQSMTKTAQYQFLSKMQLQSTQQVMQRGRGRPTLGPTSSPTQNVQAVKTLQGTTLRPAGMVFKHGSMAGGSVLVPTSYQLSGNQVFQVVGGQEIGSRLGSTSHMFLPNTPSTGTVQNLNQKKSSQQPSISITPLPRGSSGMSSSSSSSSSSNQVTAAKPGDTSAKNSFVICEICDGYIKDLDQLRNHMQWIHKIKIHPKMIYNRPPLNCQKCQFRFFTDQGLERHLLGSHGLVTSSMQDAANKSKDSGRCPVCGRVYQWKLLNHVARDHNMTLKPAHLSYKCTVCTATFGMYKQFENHVYSAHSFVAKRGGGDKKATSSASSSSSSAKSTVDQLKPLKINDEITIIPQPTTTKLNTANGKEGSPSKASNKNSKN